MSGPPPIPHLIAVEKAKSAIRRDPLATFKFRNPRQRDLVRFVRQGLEVACRAPNRSGKTTGGAALGIGIARGLTYLDGEPLPHSPCPNVGVVLARSYGQMVESVQAAYLDLIGAWPHERAYTDKQRGYIKVIRIRPDNWQNDEPETWSKIYFVSQENEDSITGFGADWVHGDEPPVEEVWREARVRIKAGRQLHRWITFTPLHRSEWEWIRSDFEGRGALEKPADGRIEMVMTLDGNRALTQAERDHLEVATRGDVFREARIRGEYVDAEGENPFAPWFDVLDRWERNASEPFSLKSFLIRDEAGNSRSAVVQVFEEPDPEETYLMVLDPSRGLGAPYDPAGIQVWGRRKRRLAARYGSMRGIIGSGYLPAYSLGILAAQVGDYYRQALADVEMQGGYGDSVMVALRQSGYANLNRDVAPDRPARIDETFGFATSVATRPQWVAAIQEALDRSRGTDYVAMPSRDVVSCLKSIVFNDKGKPLAAHGRHDEDMILMGRALHVLMDPRRKPAPYLASFMGHDGGIEAAINEDLYGKRGPRGLLAPDPEPEAW